ncbi:putative DNA N-6-adenine methyltransferase [Edwardsiella anguillarum ET080813]|uniref:Putative DNA N-6-adenine methyltransferase n=1 Tax=Edwardsiella anguillarum ET080813 TaxID=667120 RepID=A0A076LET3_9GAMM|nr:putative DNA N-6-adenine methyltransferase [Edwardsiella anguillarum ET080813]
MITGGRVNFVHAVTGAEQKGNSKGSMLLIWRPFTNSRRMITTVSKSTLEAIGRPVRSAA